MRCKALLTLAVLLLESSLFGGVLSYKELESKPKSLAKDYYIYRLLTEGAPSKIEATLLYDEVSRMNEKLQDEFTKKIGPAPKVLKTRECQKNASADISNISEECVKLIVVPNFGTNLDNKTRSKLLERLHALDYNFTAAYIGALGEKNVFEALKKAGAKEFLYVFAATPLEYKKSKLDHEFDADFIKKLAKQENFGNFVKNIVISDNFKAIPKSLLFDSSNISLDGEAAFFLGLNAIKHDHTAFAEHFFTQAAQKSYYKKDRDKALFWRYLTTKNRDDLSNLSQSYDINIYSLYAKEATNSSISNMTFYETKNAKSSQKYDMQDPFAWRDLLVLMKDMNSSELTKLAKKFDANDTLPIYAFLMERASKYRHAYFIEPYGEYLKELDKERKIMILSIARQESRFVTATISTSYALGMMQFMPFLARSTANELKLQNFDIDDMFDAQIAYKFADHHLDYLGEYLYHPLFVSYAYNGGIGFTKRLLQSKRYFNEGKYEPFLSIESVFYEESREYAKNVLANYVVYSKIFGRDVSIKALLEDLTKPSKTDKFRQTK